MPHQFPEADSRSILIVDDEEAIRNLFAIALSERYECVTAADTPEALRFLAAQQTRHHAYSRSRYRACQTGEHQGHNQVDLTTCEPGPALTYQEKILV